MDDGYLEDHIIGDRTLYGPVNNLTTSGFIEDQTRITVALPDPDSDVQFVLHLGFACGSSFQANRDDLTRLRDTLTEALEAGEQS